ncbi:acyl dehydratase [Alphaproteobacteria bacterium]|nr:acyl dehydratase [Alphaproteobacteria bacterium]
MHYLEDFTPGMVLRAGPIDVLEDEIISFAKRYDPQVFHTDPEAAKTTFFKGLAASGWLTASLSMRLFIDTGIADSGEMIGGEMEHLRWTTPVRPGDSLHLTVTVLEVAPSRSKPSFGWLRLRCDSFNQKEEIVQTLFSRVMVPARPA